MGVLQIFDNFFDDTSSRQILPGRLVWVPTAQVDLAPKILEVERHSPHEHEAVSFKISEVNQSHFKHKDRLPIARFRLGSNEEAMISRAKKRLCVVLAVIGEIDDFQFPDKSQQKLAQHLFKTKTYIVAPTYSVSTNKDPGTFSPIIVGRIRALQYPQFFCLPDKDPPEVPRSIVRLDRIFPTNLARACDVDDRQIHEEPFSIIKEQLLMLLEPSLPHEKYDMIKELAEESLSG